MGKLYKIFARNLVIPLSLFFLLKSFIDVLLGKYLVSPILSNCAPPSYTLDIAALFLLIAFSLPYCFKAFMVKRIPLKAFVLSITILVIYLSYRIPNTPFVFTETKAINSIKIADILFTSPLFVCLAYLWFYLVDFLKKKNCTNVTENTLGFSVDEPITINKDNDLLNRNKFINVIIDKIRNTETKNGSFPIGIVAKWGSGKTSFIKTILNEFTDEEIVKIELDVWKCSNNSQMIEALFKELKKKLGKYSFTINNQLQNYAVSLLKGVKDEGLNSIKNITELILPDVSLARQYENINEEIKQIGKKIIVVIDDLDRLDKKEVYEVIRLIRNTANFANTFFIVAYDRTYILNAIEDINPYQAHYFLEKIFQIEFSLPVISDTILHKEIQQRIEPFLTKADKSGYKMLQERGFTFFEYGDADLTTSFIYNIRDVVRFVNSFKLSYEFVKDEVYFPDFYNLELIKFKHPDLFTMIYKEHHKLFTTDINGAGSFNGSSNTYSLQKTYENGKKTSVSELRTLIESNKKNFKLSDKDIDMVCIAYGSIFPEPNNILSSRKKTLNYHLSALRPSMFDRYFILGIEGKLSEITFSKMRQMPYEDFIKMLEDLVYNQDLSFELSVRFEQIQSFDNKEDFEKIIKGIFHFANLPSPQNRDKRLETINYNGKELATILGKEDLIRFYNNDVNQYREFLTSLLKTNTAVYTYTNDFTNLLLRDCYYYIERVLDKDIISNILLFNFENAITKYSKFSNVLFWHFVRCEKRVHVADTGSSYQVNYPIREEAIRVMRKFILEKDIDGFILYSIKQTPFNKRFIIEGAISTVFKRNEYFVRLINLYKLQSKYKKEFTEFYNLYINDNEKKGVPYEFFKEIPIQLRNE